MATFRGGSYAWSLPGSSVSDQFDSLKIAINGTEYTLDGTLDHVFASFTFTGEIRITTNGTLMARLYSNVGLRPSIEVLTPLVPF